MSIGYILEIEDWGIVDNPLDEDGKCPHFCDENCRDYQVILISEEAKNGQLVRRESVCCNEMSSAIWEGIIRKGGDYKNKNFWLYLDSRKGSHSFKLTDCPFCGENVELVCKKVRVVKPTFVKEWRRKGKELVEEYDPTYND